VGILGKCACERVFVCVRTYVCVYICALNPNLNLTLNPYPKL